MKPTVPAQRPKVTVYVPCHNYGRYLAEAIESVRSQVLQEWELIVLDDGSSDETSAVAQRYVAQDPQRVRLLRHRLPKGLRQCANRALALARGEYFVRLDADDYLDESALLVLAGYLDVHRDVALVYPNWTYVAEDGTHLGVERRKRIGTEATVLDLPPHGACTMVRRRVLRTLGGYDTRFEAQDGHELWLKVLRRHRVANVATPLFFYRQHPASMSVDEDKLLAARREIKRRLARPGRGNGRPVAVAIVPAKNTYSTLPNIVLRPLLGKPLIDYTIEAARRSGSFDLCYVYTDDDAVVAHCSMIDGVLAERRPSELSSARVGFAEILVSAVNQLETAHGVFPDIVALLNVNAPLRGEEHIREAVDTLLLHDVDSVLSAYEDLDLHFIHTKEGLRPLNPGRMQKVRFEREAIYVDNSAVHVLWRDSISTAGLFSGRVGHIVMPRRLSQAIKSEKDIVIVEAILASERRADVDS